MSAGVEGLKERSNRQDRRTSRGTLPQWTAGVGVSLFPSPFLPRVLLVSDKLKERWWLCHASDHWQVWKAVPGQGLPSLHTFRKPFKKYLPGAGEMLWYLRELAVPSRQTQFRTQLPCGSPMPVTSAVLQGYLPHMHCIYLHRHMHIN